MNIIFGLTKFDCWRNINSQENPADIISKELDPNKIQDCGMWWFGPPILHRDEVIKSSHTG